MESNVNFLWFYTDFFLTENCFLVLVHPPNIKLTQTRNHFIYFSAAPTAGYVRMEGMNTWEATTECCAIDFDLIPLEKQSRDKQRFTHLRSVFASALFFFVNFSFPPPRRVSPNCRALTLYNCYCISIIVIYKSDFDSRVENAERRKRNLNVFFMFSLSSDRFFIRFLLSLSSFFFRGYCKLPHHLYWCYFLSPHEAAQGRRWSHESTTPAGLASPALPVLLRRKLIGFLFLNYSFTCVSFRAPFFQYRTIESPLLVEQNNEARASRQEFMVSIGSPCALLLILLLLFVFP